MHRRFEFGRCHVRRPNSRREDAPDPFQFHVASFRLLTRNPRRLGDLYGHTRKRLRPAGIIPLIAEDGELFKKLAHRITEERIQ